MTFKFVIPTVKLVAQIALDAAGDPLGSRVLQQEAGFKLVIDAKRNAYLMAVNSTMRHNSSQNHYMMYFMNRFWHIRTRSTFSQEVGFYNVPWDFEKIRPEIELCFSEAIAVHGWFGDVITAKENSNFIPIFGENDYEPPDI